MALRLDIEIDLPDIAPIKVINAFWKGVSLDTEAALRSPSRTRVHSPSGRSRRQWKVIQQRGGRRPVFRINNRNRGVVILNNSKRHANQHGRFGTNPYYRMVQRTIDRNHDQIVDTGLARAQRVLQEQVDG